MAQLAKKVGVQISPAQLLQHSKWQDIILAAYQRKFPNLIVHFSGSYLRFQGVVMQPKFYTVEATTSVKIKQAKEEAKSVRVYANISN